MSSLPRRVEFHEEGPREGFQMEKGRFPLADRLALIDALAASGLKQVQCASFVSPRAVPQMADSAELFAGLRKRPGTRYTALWLNESGFDRARACDNVDVDGKIIFYVTESFSQRNNNCGVAENRDRQLAWIDRYIALGIPLEQAYVVTAFGCNLGGPVPVSAVTDVVRWLADVCADRRIPFPAFYLATRWAGRTPRRSSAASARCARSCRRPASGCTCTTRVASVPPTSTLRCRRAWSCSTVRWRASAAVPSQATSTAAPPATSAPRTWPSCARKWASRLAWTSSGSSRLRAWPSASSAAR